MYVLACIPIYGDRGRDFCCDPAGSQESAPELRVGCELAIKNAPNLLAVTSRLTDIYLARAVSLFADNEGVAD